MKLNSCAICGASRNGCNITRSFTGICGGGKQHERKILCRVRLRRGYSHGLHAIYTVAKWVNDTTALLNWSPSAADSAGHCAANAYLVEKSSDGAAFTFERVVIPTEVYITVGSNTHYRVTPVGDAGNGDPLTVLVSGFTPAG